MPGGKADQLEGKGSGSAVLLMTLKYEVAFLSVNSASKAALLLMNATLNNDIKAGIYGRTGNFPFETYDRGIRSLNSSTNRDLRGRRAILIFASERKTTEV